MTSTLQSKLDHLPDQPGVYLFRDEQGELLYIGKAAVLSNRVKSYFQKGTDHSPKHTVLVSHIADLETIVTRSELEALILESNLIKQHRPRFNVVLRDDKQYPYLRLPIKLLSRMSASSSERVTIVSRSAMWLTRTVFFGEWSVPF